MSFTKNNWLSRLFKSFRKSEKKSTKKAHTLRLEALEERAMLNVAPILTLDSNSYSVETDLPYYIPLTSTDDDGDVVYYKVEVDSGTLTEEDLTCDLSIGTEWDDEMKDWTDSQFETYNDKRNPYWELTLYQEDNEALKNTKMLFELFADKTPVTINTIESLTTSEFWQSGANYYDYTHFHRIIDDFMIQGGGFEWFSDGQYNVSSLLSTIEDEYNKDLRMTQSGVLAMANTGSRDTGSGQFFITDDACEWLDFQHTVFGVLVDGQEVLEAASSVQTTDIQGNLDYNFYNGTEWVSYYETYGSYPTMQGTPTKTVGESLYLDPVTLVSAEIVENETNSVLTIKATEAGTVRLKVTPVDKNGESGTAKYINVTVTEKESTYDTPPILNLDHSYFTVAPNKTTSDYTISAYDAQDNAIGYAAELYQIVYDESGNGSLQKVEGVVSCDYSTGVVTVDSSTLSQGAYYLREYVAAASSATTSQDVIDNYSDARYVGMIVVPEAPKSVKLSEGDDSEPVGDNKTTENTNLSFVVDGCTPVYTVAVFCGETLVGYTTCAEGQTSVTVTSSFGGEESVFPYGSFELTAYQVKLDQTFYYFGLGWQNISEVYSEASETYTFCVILETPVEITATPASGTSLDLSWSAVTGATGYYLEYRIQGTTEWTYGTWEDESTPTACNLSGLTSGTTYEIRVSAYADNNISTMSLPSEIITVTMPVTQLEVPTNVWSEKNESTISCSWEAVENAVGYIVYYRVYGEESWSIGVENTEDLQAKFDIDTADGTVMYEVAVQAVATEGTGTDPSDLAIAISDTTNLPYLAATMKSWSDRAKTEAIKSVNEWEFLSLNLTANATDLVKNGGLKFVYQYDGTLFEPDFTNSEFNGVEYSYKINTVNEETSLSEVTVVMTVKDTSKIENNLVGYLKMVPVAQSLTTAGQTGVKLTDETKELKLTVFANDGKTAEKSTTLTTTVWAVPYDLDDSGKVDSNDFLTFATNYGQPVVESKKDTIYFCDFNVSNKVESNDFLLFATYYGMSYTKDGASIYIQRQTTAETPATSQATVAVPVEQPIEIFVPQSTTVSSTTYLIDPNSVLKASSSFSAQKSDNATSKFDYVNQDDSVRTAQENESTPDMEVALNSPLSIENVDLFFDAETFEESDDNSDNTAENVDIADELLSILSN